MKGKILRREEKVVLFYTVGLADREGEALHLLLASGPDYNFESVKRQAARLRSSPISCLKIRELIPEVTSSVNCNCALDLRGGKYPSPLLHINPHLVPVAREFALPESMPVREAARRYIDLRQHREEADKALKRLEQVLEEHFCKNKIDQLILDDLVLRRVRDKDGISWEMEKV